MKNENNRKLRNFFIVINILLVAGIFSSFLLYKTDYLGIITPKVVYNFQEKENLTLNSNLDVIEINYEKGAEREIDFLVLNSEHRNMQVLLTIEGEMNDSVELYDNLVEFMASDESKKFKYKFKMPDEIANSPGLHSVQIVALEIPRTSPGETYAGSSSKIVSTVKVYVPYPGKYVDADLNIIDAEQNATAKFSIRAINRGSMAIENARATIDIYTLLNEKIASFESDSKPIGIDENSELTSSWQVKTAPGDYIARFTVYYDGEKREFEKKFAVGAKDLAIKGILVNNFQLGEIAKLQILVENSWNQELKDVFANLIVYNKEGQIMVDVKSTAENIPSLSKKELIAYWDTIGVQEGEYNGKLMVMYGEKTTGKDLLLKVSSNSLEITGVGYAIRGGQGGGLNMITILFVFVILLVIVNLAWFVFFRRAFRKTSEESSRKVKKNGKFIGKK